MRIDKALAISLYLLPPNHVFMPEVNPLSKDAATAADTTKKDTDPQRKRTIDYLTSFFLLFCVVGGLTCIIAMCFCLKPKAPNSFASDLGLFLAVALASLATGGLLGFLFGIPRSLQRNAVDVNNGSSHSDNTNLEQISDWLTKIIVGVSLTQMNRIGAAFDNMMKYMIAGFDEGSRSIAYPFMGSLILFFAISGFLTIYLWSKMDLLIMLVNNDRLTRLTSEVEAKVKETVQQTVTEKVAESRVTLDKDMQDMKNRNLDLEIASLSTKRDLFTRQRTRTIDAESIPEFKSVIELVKPGPITVLDDAQKFRWGGTPEAGGYRLAAAYEKDANGEKFHVEVTVAPMDPAGTLTGDVYFFLHDSYYPNNVVKVEATGNKASFKIDAIEAFTVGAICLDAQVMLELDMNSDPNAPEDFKYTEQLTTISALDEQLRILTELKSSN